jgi:membrane associated rhomboid family serine protease
MVGPSISDEEREGKSLQLKLGFVLVVAASGVLIGVWAGGSVEKVLGGGLGGLVLGVVLAWYLSWLAGQARLKEKGRSRHPTRGDGGDERRRR